MEIAELQIYEITKDYSPAEGKAVSLSWDANKFTGELGRRMARTYRTRAAFIEAAGNQPKAKGRGKKKVETLSAVADELACEMEVRAALEDIEREVYADVLASDRYRILTRWGATRQGVSTEPTFGVLMTLPDFRLKDMLAFCRRESLPEKKETATTNGQGTTALTTSDISLAPTTHAPESLPS